MPLKRAALMLALGAALAAGEARAEGACPSETDGARQARASSGHDRWLSGYTYPYPVRRFELDVQGTRACMAYTSNRRCA